MDISAGFVGRRRVLSGFGGNWRALACFGVLWRAPVKTRQDPPKHAKTRQRLSLSGLARQDPPNTAKTRQTPPMPAITRQEPPAVISGCLGSIYFVLQWQYSCTWMIFMYYTCRDLLQFIYNAMFQHGRVKKKTKHQSEDNVTACIHLFYAKSVQGE